MSAYSNQLSAEEILYTKIGKLMKDWDWRTSFNREDFHRAFMEHIHDYKKQALAASPAAQHECQCGKGKPVCTCTAQHEAMAPAGVHGDANIAAEVMMAEVRKEGSGAALIATALREAELRGIKAGLEHVMVTIGGFKENCILPALLDEIRALNPETILEGK